MKTKTIKLVDIVIDAGTQQREKINDDVVSEYTEAMKCGARFPAITAFFNGSSYYLVDGYHRYNASRNAGISDILADVIDGTKREAVLYSLGVNNTHGIRLTNADKRKAVLTMILDDEWKYWTDTKISKHCHVTSQFVGKIRKENDSSNDNDNHLENETVSFSPPEPALNLETDQKLSTVSEENHEDYDQKDTDSQEPEYTELDQIKDELNGTYETIRTLTEEKNKLLDSLAAGQLPEDEIVSAEQTMIDLRNEIKSLTAQVVALTEARDKYLNQYNAEVKNSKYFMSMLKKAGLLNAKP